MDHKIGVYIDTGYGIGEALDIDALSKVATGRVQGAGMQSRTLLERSGQAGNYQERHSRRGTHRDHHRRSFPSSLPG